MDQAVADVVERVLRRHPAWEEPGRPGALQQCSIASRELLAELEDEGITASLLWLVGPRGDLSRAHPEAAHSAEHLTVQVGDEILDLTRRQWDCASEHPTVYASLSAAGTGLERLLP